MVQINTRIHGDLWTWIIVPTDSLQEYVPDAASDDAAMTLTTPKLVYIEEESFNLEVVRHELLHVEAYYFRHADAGLTTDQLEEVFCSWISTEVSKFSRRATTIFRRLRGVLDATRRNEA